MSHPLVICSTLLSYVPPFCHMSHPLVLCPTHLSYAPPTCHRSHPLFICLTLLSYAPPTCHTLHPLIFHSNILLWPYVVGTSTPINGEDVTWWKEEVKDIKMNDISLGYKFVLLLEILKKCEEIGDKVYVCNGNKFSII